MRNLQKNSKAVILLSGGIDSTTSLYLAKKYVYDLWALIFDYGQRHNREITSAIKIAKISKVKYHLLKISVPWTNSALTKKDIKVPFALVFFLLCFDPLVLSFLDIVTIQITVLPFAL